MKPFVAFEIEGKGLIYWRPLLALKTHRFGVPKSLALKVANMSSEEFEEFTVYMMNPAESSIAERFREWLQNQ